MFEGFSRSKFIQMFENLELYGAVQLFSFSGLDQFQLMKFCLLGLGYGLRDRHQVLLGFYTCLQIWIPENTRRYRSMESCPIQVHTTHLQHCPHQICFLQHSTCGNSSPKRLSRSECFNTSTLSATTSWRQWQLSTKRLLPIY